MSPMARNEVSGFGTNKKKTNILSNRGLCFLLLFLGAVLLAQEALFVKYTYEDAYISFRYSRNFAKGLGLVFNPGERVEGYSNFLWVLLLSAPPKLGLDIILVARILGPLFSLGTLPVQFGLSRKLSSPKGWGHSLSLLFLVFSPPFLIWSATGLETPLYTFLITLGCYLFLGCPNSRRILVSSVCFALVAMSRPEGVMFCVLAIAGILLQRLQRNISTKDLLLFLMPLAAIYGSYFIWRILFYGYPLPNTYYAKAGAPVLEQSLRGWRKLSAFVLTYRNGLVLPFVFLHLVVHAIDFNRAFILACLASQIAFMIWSGGAVALDPSFRFLVPVLPLFYLLVQEGIKDFLNMAAVYSPRRLFIARWAVIVTLLWSLGANISNTLSQRRFWDVQIAQNLKPRIEFARQLKRWLPYNWTVSYTDMGSFAFYAGLPMIDGLGLVDEYVAHQMFDYGETVVSVRELTPAQQNIADYILSRKPDLIILTGFSPEETNARKNLDFQFGHMKAIATSQAFRDDYRYLRTINALPPGVLAGWPRGRYLYVYIRADIPQRYEHAWSLAVKDAINEGAVTTARFERTSIPYLIEAEDMEHDVGGPTPNGWNIYSGGRIGSAVKLYNGPTVFCVIASGDAALDEGPLLTVLLDGEMIGQAFVTASHKQGEWRPYIFEAETETREYRLDLEFSNAFYDPQTKQDRNLYVEKVIIGQSNLGQPPCFPAR